MSLSFHVHLSPHLLMTKSLLYISSTVGECWCWNWSNRNLLRMEVLPTPSAPITTSFALFSFQSMIGQHCWREEGGVGETLNLETSYSPGLSSRSSIILDDTSNFLSTTFERKPKT